MPLPAPVMTAIFPWSGMLGLPLTDMGQPRFW